MKAPVQINKHTPSFDVSRLPVGNDQKGLPEIFKFKSIFEQQIAQESPGSVTHQYCYPDQEQLPSNPIQENPSVNTGNENCTGEGKEVTLAADQDKNINTERLDTENTPAGFKPEKATHTVADTRKKSENRLNNLSPKVKESLRQANQTAKNEGVTFKSAKKGVRQAVFYKSNISLRSNLFKQGQADATGQSNQKEAAPDLYQNSRQTRMTNRKIMPGNAGIHSQKGALAFLKVKSDYAQTRNNVNEFIPGSGTKKVINKALQVIQNQVRQSGSNTVENKRPIPDSQKVQTPRENREQLTATQVKNKVSTQGQTENSNLDYGQAIKANSKRGNSFINSSAQTEQSGHRSTVANSKTTPLNAIKEINPTSHKDISQLQFIHQNLQKDGKSTHQQHAESKTSAAEKATPKDQSELKKTALEPKNSAQSNQDSVNQNGQKASTVNFKISQMTKMVSIGEQPSGRVTSKTAEVHQSVSARDSKQDNQSQIENSAQKNTSNQKETIDKTSPEVSVKKQNVTTDKFVNINDHKISLNPSDLFKLRLSTFMKAQNLTELQSFSKIRIELIQKITQIVNNFNTGKTTQTNFHIDGKEYGPLEIQFAKGPSGDQATILVENETVRAALRKYMPSVFDSLQEKGILLSSLDVEINDRHKQKAFGSLNYWQAEDGKQQNINGKETQASDGGETARTSPRYYGYNTMEVLA